MAARPSPAFRAAAFATVAAALLSACTTPGPQAVDGASIAGGPSGTGVPTATSAPTGSSAPKTLPGPLTGKDLPGWKDHALPSALAGAWVSPCGDALNVHLGQATTRGTELTGPRGITVQTRVGTYAKAAGSVAALAAADAALNACPLTDGRNGDTVTISLQDAPAGQQAVGAVISTTNADGALTDVVGYWIAKVGNGTVEVRAQGRFIGADAEDPMVTFSRALLTSALAKAVGAKVPALPAPQLAPAVSSGSGAGPDGTDTGSDVGTGAGDGAAGGEAGAGGGDMGSGGDIMAPAPEIPGVGGDDGPGVISGSDPGEPLP